MISLLTGGETRKNRSRRPPPQKNALSQTPVGGGRPGVQGDGVQIRRQRRQLPFQLIQQGFQFRRRRRRLTLHQAALLRRQDLQLVGNRAGQIGGIGNHPVGTLFQRES